MVATTDSKVTSPDPGKAALVISLDFEKMWGVRDKVRPDSPYAASILGVDEVVGKTLAMFENFRIKATWATVGMLFAGSLEESRSFWPSLKPTYQDSILDPYLEDSIEKSDPRLWWADDLISDIAATPGQEIGTHTFSHYYATAPGQNLLQFKADLQAAVNIAKAKGITMESIIFPRHHYDPSYISSLPSFGITQFRRDAPSWSTKIRLARFLNDFIPLDTAKLFSPHDCRWDSELSDVRASVFFRPHMGLPSLLEKRKTQRLVELVDRAAQKRQMFHLWWHPHNFSKYQDQNFEALERVLTAFARHRDAGHMESLTMADYADSLRNRGKE